MTCWRGWRPGITENFKLRTTRRLSSSTASTSPSLPRNSCSSDIRNSSPAPRSPAPGGKDSKPREGSSGSGSGEIIFIQSCRAEERKGLRNSWDSSLEEETKATWILSRFLDFLHFPFRSHFVKRKVDVSPPSLNIPTFFGSEVNGVLANQPSYTFAPELQRPPKMEHSELVKELSHIEKLTNQERLKLAHNRRKLQLKYWNQYEKLLNNSSVSGGGNNNKKGLGGKNSQHQKMLEQLQQQEQLRKAKSSKNKPKVRFCNSIMLLEAAGRNDIAEGKTSKLIIIILNSGS